jgi:hypothetical protein
MTAPLKDLYTYNSSDIYIHLWIKMIHHHDKTNVFVVQMFSSTKKVRPNAHTYIYIYYILGISFSRHLFGTIRKPRELYATREQTQRHMAMMKYSVDQHSMQEPVNDEERCPTPTTYICIYILKTVSFFLSDNI